MCPLRLGGCCYASSPRSLPQAYFPLETEKGLGEKLGLAVILKNCANNKLVQLVLYKLVALQNCQALYYFANACCSPASATFCNSSALPLLFGARPEFLIAHTNTPNIII